MGFARRFAPVGRALYNPYVIWAVLALPGVYWLIAWARGSLVYGEFVHATGDFAVQVLILTLACTPLRVLFPRAGWVRWLTAQRRYLGVAVCAYALLHTLAYLQRKADPGAVAAEAVEPWMAAGWVAMLILLPLTVTSNDRSVRRLGPWWGRLHKLVYPAAALALLHWVFSAFDPTTAYIHAGVLGAVVVLRVVLARP